MTLIDAIKSGRPFRRPCFPEGRWYSYLTGTRIYIHPSGDDGYGPDKDDILADDWEIKVERICITFDQFYKAMAGKHETTITNDMMYISQAGIRAVARALGFTI